MIDSYQFRTFIIKGKEYNRNIKLFDKEVREYKYIPEHTLVLDDITDLINYNPLVIIIGTGAYGLMKLSKEISEYIERRRIRLVVQKTADACKTYNQSLKEGKKVAAFMHNTC